ncbi:MAG: hypothetical protein FJ224_00570 [Lentisphaerae bacterium]|nr:hypothetical protein [Lentisphaerota bacterium]
MPAEPDVVERIPVVAKSFAAIAFWQFAAFLLLILLIWANGTVDLPYLVFGTEKSGLDFFGCSVLTCGVMVTAILTVGNTYLRQRKFAASLVTVCSSCHRVRISRQAWEAVEDYIASHSAVTFSHGLCPDCMEKIRTSEGLDRTQGVRPE